MPHLNESKHAGSHWWAEAGTLTQVAVFMVIVATSWFMLKELAALLRPLLMAILLCYALLPLHSRIRKGRSEIKTVVLMAGGALAITSALAILIYGSIVDFNEELPRLTKRATEMSTQGQKWSNEHLPLWVGRGMDDLLRAEATGAQHIQDSGKAVLRYTADLLLEAIVVGLYVIFLLIEARRIPGRVQGGFDTERAKRILDTVETINDGIANYLKAKVKASIILAVPVTLILLVFGVKFAIIWGLLTFFCNFIPYVGSVVACGSPLIFSFLDLPFGFQPFAVAALLIACHVGSASFVEPTMIGNAVGLSPLIILMSLTFWGLCWGIVGMFLAVPLTVTMKIVLTNIEPTKGIARLLGGDA